MLKEVSVNFVGAEDFINSKIRDMLSRKIFYQIGSLFFVYALLLKSVDSC